MGGKRGVCMPFLAAFMIIAAMTIAGCICGLDSLVPQDISKAGHNVSSLDQADGRSISSTAPVVRDTPYPTLMSAPAPALTPSPGPSSFTVYAEGGKDHRPGETLRLYGTDTYSDAVYLFVSCMGAPISGGRLNDTRKPVVDMNAATFARVNVSEDGSWEYRWTMPSGKPALMFDLYEVIAVAEPRDKPHLDEAPAWDMVTVRISEYRG
jgi:hypothetical protein